MPVPRFYGRRMEGKRAIVTGAGAEGDDVSIGRAIAIALASEGAAVACVDMVAQRAEQTARALRDEGFAAHAITGDVSRYDECARIVGEAVDLLGGVDTLVNNVGISTANTEVSLEEEFWDRILAVNLKSAVAMSRSALPHMIAAGGGSITNITSIAGIRAHGTLAYGSSKAAMAHLARDISARHGRQGIRGNAVAPGHVMTPHVLKVMPPRSRDMRRKVGMLNLEGDAWDVALAVLFLASDEARFITGIELAVDGGVTETGPLYAHGMIMAPD